VILVYRHAEEGPAAPVPANLMSQESAVSSVGRGGSCERELFEKELVRQLELRPDAREVRGSGVLL
jgi:hypothetical protein